MLDVNLPPRRRAERRRSGPPALVGTQKPEQLEPRVVLSVNGVGDAAGFEASGYLHNFTLTSITQDADNDGRVNTRSLVIRGEIDRGGLVIGAHGTTGLTVTASGPAGTNSSLTSLQLVNGDTELDFTLNVTLPAGNNTPQLQYSVAFGALSFDVFTSDGMGGLTGTQLTSNLTVVPPNAPNLLPGSDTGTSNSDNITASRTPTFSISGIEAAGNLQLLRDGTVVDSSIVNGPADGAIQLTDNTVPAAGGVFAYTARLGNNGVASPSLMVTVVTGGLGVSSLTIDGPDLRNTPVPSATVTFNNPIDPTSFDVSDVSLTRDGNPVDLTGAGLTFTMDSPTVFHINGLSSVTSAAGDYVLVVDAGGVQDVAANPGEGTLGHNFTVDLTPPQVSSVAIADSVGTPRSTPVGAVDVTFSEAIDPTSFSTADLSLTHNGNIVPLGPGVTVAMTSPTVFRVSGLESATSAEGSYVLTVHASGVQDLADNAGTGTGQVMFQIDLGAPVFTFVPASIDVAVLPGADGAAVAYPTPTATDSSGVPPTVTCNPVSRSLFPLGTTVVTCTATDAAGNSTTATFTINVHVIPPDTTAPTVLDARLFRVGPGLNRISVTYSEPMDLATVSEVRNYTLRLAGHDHRFGTPDDVVFQPIGSSYDVNTNTVTLIPGNPILLDHFVQLTINAAPLVGVQDTSGNLLAGGPSGQAGTDYVAYLAIGRHLSFNDADGDQASLALRGGGQIEVNRDASGSVRLVRLTDTMAGRSVLFGQVRRRRLQGDGRVAIPSLLGLDGVRNRLAPSKFPIGPIAMPLRTLMAFAPTRRHPRAT